MYSKVDKWLRAMIDLQADAVPLNQQLIDYAELLIKAAKIEEQEAELASNIPTLDEAVAKLTKEDKTKLFEEAAEAFNLTKDDNLVINGLDFNGKVKADFLLGKSESYEILKTLDELYYREDIASITMLTNTGIEEYGNFPTYQAHKSNQ